MPFLRDMPPQCSHAAESRVVHLHLHLAQGFPPVVCTQVLGHLVRKGHARWAREENVQTLGEHLARMQTAGARILKNLKSSS